MKKTLTLLFSIIALWSYSQQVQYSYDASGNRIQRKKVLIDSPTDQETGRMASPETIAKHTEEGMKIAMQEGISVFPNPTEDFVKVMVNNFKEEDKITVQLIDNMGKVLKTQSMQSSTIQFAVSELPSGIYYINVIKGKEKLFYKVIKQ